MGKHQTINTRTEHYSPRVNGSIPVRGNLFTQIVHSYHTKPATAEPYCLLHKDQNIFTNKCSFESLKKNHTNFYC